mgnify:CR=1 FL=1
MSYNCCYICRHECPDGEHLNHTIHVRHPNNRRPSHSRDNDGDDAKDGVPNSRHPSNRHTNNWDTNCYNTTEKTIPSSAATRGVAQIVLLDDRFATLPYVVAEGRRVIGNIERVAHLFLTKTVYSVVLALVVAVLGSST